MPIQHSKAGLMQWIWKCSWKSRLLILPPISDISFYIKIFCISPTFFTGTTLQFSKVIAYYVLKILFKITQVFTEFVLHWAESSMGLKSRKASQIAQNIKKLPPAELTLHLFWLIKTYSNYTRLQEEFSANCPISWALLMTEY